MPCLARWRDTLQIQCIAVDPHTTVGVIDLQICLQAITQGSPELVNHTETDYTIYAVDFSEPDTPMVGQGMLSWVLSAPSRKDVKQLITGRVTRNKFSVFGHGPRETLEVRLQLKPIMFRQQQQAPLPCPVQEANDSREQSPIVRQPSFSASSETAEWNSFVRSTSSFGQERPGGSPTIAPAPLTHRQRQEAPKKSMQRPLSIQAPQRPQQQQQQRRVSPSVPSLLPAGESVQSRPSSRNSARQSKAKGRPRKKAILQEGNNSGYEDGTEAEDGPTRKKRAQVTRVEKTGRVGFATQSESLRGVAIASESLRNIHPTGPAEYVGGTASHLQEVPRVPTPVPMRRLEPKPEGRPPPARNLRRQSLNFSKESRAVATPNTCLDVAPAPAPHVARSPGVPINPSPEKPGTPAESPADIASSPPIPQSTYTPHVPSSPVLPPMPSQDDSGFMSGGIDENRVEDPEIPKQMPAPAESVAAPQKPKPKRTSKKSTKTASAAPAPTLTEANMVMVHPGPATLLPKTSLYNPPPHIKRRLAEAASNQNNNNNNPSAPQSQPRQLEKQPSMSPLKPAQLTQTSSNNQDLPLSASAAVYPAQPAPDARAVSSQTSQQFPSAEEFEAFVHAISPEMALPSQTPISQSVEMAFETNHNDAFDDEVQHHPLGPELVPTPEDLQASTRKDPLPAPTSYSRTQESTRESPARPNESAPSVACTLPTIPASDPVLPPLVNVPELCQAPCPQTDALKLMPSKNYAKKQMIKDKLSEAVARGELPTYCVNCGAIETPTWRKMYYQEHKGMPPFIETSKEPGRVVSVDVLDRDTKGQPSRYRYVKKTLSEEDIREDWQETTLCNRKSFFIFFYFIFFSHLCWVWGFRCGGRK